MYISQSNLYVKGTALFQGNKADSGAGIYSINSAVMFHGKSDVNFVNNFATTNGAAIYQIFSTTVFEKDAI